jgi:hypothetical protein
MSLQAVPLPFMILVSLPFFMVVTLMFKRAAVDNSPSASRAKFDSAGEAVLFEQYSSSQGYSSKYMDRLIYFLQQKEVSATYKQTSQKQQDSSAESADQIFSLYVSKGQEVRANNFVKRFRESEKSFS